MLSARILFLAYASFLLFCLIVSVTIADSAFAKSNAYNIPGFLRPSNLTFPVVFYLSMDHPGPHKAMVEAKTRTLSPQLKQDDNITLPIYLGYLVVSNTNQVRFINRNSKYPFASILVNTVLVAHNQQPPKNNRICSEEPPFFCAEPDTWTAVWVLLNDLWRKGVYVSAYTKGTAPDQHFVPYYTNSRDEKQRLASVLHAKDWPVFSNNTLSMHPFKQAWNLPIYADSWKLMGEVTKVTGQRPADLKFPLVFYISLTSQGVYRQAPKNEEFENLKAPLYAGHLIVDHTYAYRFTRKINFPVSLTTLASAENALRPMGNSEFVGIYNSGFQGTAHTWGGVGIFLAKLINTGDYEVFAYSSGKSPDYNYNPSFRNQKLLRHRDNIASSLMIYDNLDAFPQNYPAGLSSFNSLIFFDPNGAELWKKGEFKPSHEQEWPNQK